MIKNIIAFFFITTICFSQDRNIQIQLLNNNINELKYKLSINQEKSLSRLKEIYKKSNQIDYKIGEALALINIGKIEGDKGDFKQALVDIEEARKISMETENDSLQLFSDFALCIQYGRTGLNEKAISIINDCLKKSECIKDNKSKHFFLGQLYGFKAFFSGGLKLQPSIKEYFHLHRQAFYHFNKISKIVSNSACNNLGDCFNKIGQLDSAEYYFKKAIIDSKRFKHKSCEIMYTNLAEIYYKKNINKLAIPFLDSSTAICVKKKCYYLLADNYNLYKNIYKRLGDKEKYTNYLNLQLIYQDSVATLANMSTKDAINYIIKTKDDNTAKTKKVWNAVIIFLMFLVSILMVFFIPQYLKKEKIKIQLAIKNKNLESNKTKIIELTQKVTTSYEEVIVMAKKDNPLFINCFKELYPDFYTKLTATQPNLTLTEKKVCFYIKLKFSTKEIAEYTFVTIKAIQNRKNRLRKHLSLKEGEDLYEWLDHL
jgi:TPR repeat protein